jgi:hypothetical protein
MTDATTQQETPPGLIRWRGQLRPRRVGLVLNLRGLECPEGHRVDVHGRIGAAGLRCEHRARPGAEQCGAWLLLLLMSPDTTHGWRRRFWATDITLDELKEVEGEHLDATEIISRFGGIFPPGRAI